MNKQASNVNDYVVEETNEEKGEADVRPYAGAEGSKECKLGTIPVLQKSSNMVGKPELLVGDLVWSKIPGHAWWPSMVSYEPNKAVYFQSSGKGKSCFKYHVQFFGDEPQRGWVSDKSMIRFQGRNSFIGASSISMSKRDKTLHSKQLAAWERALVQAEKALPLNRQQRKLCYVFKYNDEHVSHKGSKKSPDSQAKKKEKAPKKTMNTKPRVTRRSTVLDKAGALNLSLIEEQNDKLKEKNIQQSGEHLGKSKMPCLRSGSNHLLEDSNCNLLSNEFIETKDGNKIDAKACHMSCQNKKSWKSEQRNPKAKEEMIKSDVLIGDIDNVSSSKISKKLGNLGNGTKKINCKKKHLGIDKEDLEENAKKIKLETTDVNKKVLKNKQTQTPVRQRRKVGSLVRSKTKHKSLSKAKITTQKHLLTKKVLTKKRSADDAKLKSRGRSKVDNKGEKLSGKNIKMVKATSKKGAKGLVTTKKYCTAKTKKAITKAEPSKQVNKNSLKISQATKISRLSELETEEASSQKDENAGDANRLQENLSSSILGVRANSLISDACKSDVSNPDLSHKPTEQHTKDGAMKGKSAGKNARKLGVKKQKRKVNAKCKALRSISSKQIKTDKVALDHKIGSNVDSYQHSAQKDLEGMNSSKSADFTICKVLPGPEIDDLFADFQTEIAQNVDKVQEVPCNKNILDNLDFEAEIPIEVTWTASNDSHLYGCEENDVPNNSKDFDCAVVLNDKEDSQMDSQTATEELEKEADEVANILVKKSDVNMLLQPSQSDCVINQFTEKNLELSKSLTYNINDDFIDNLLDIKSNKYISGYSKDEIIKQTKNCFKETETVEIAWSDKSSEVNENNDLRELNRNTELNNCTELDVDRMYLVDSAKDNVVQSIFETAADVAGELFHPAEGVNEDNSRKETNTTDNTPITNEKTSSDCNDRNFSDEDIQASLALVSDACCDSDALVSGTNCDSSALVSGTCCASLALLSSTLCEPVTLISGENCCTKMRDFCINSAEEVNAKFLDQENHTSGEKITSDCILQCVNTAENSIAECNSVFSTSTATVSREFKPNIGTMDCGNKKDNEDMIPSTLFVENACPCSDSDNGTAMVETCTENESSDTCLEDKNVDAVPFQNKFPDHEDYHAQSSPAYSQNRISHHDNPTFTFDNLLSHESDMCNQVVRDMDDQNGKHDLPECTESSPSNKSNVAVMGADGEAEQPYKPLLTLIENECITKSNTVSNQVGIDRNSENGECATVNNEPINDPAVTIVNADEGLHTQIPAKPSVEADNPCTQSSSVHNDSLGNSSCSLLSSPDRHSIDSGKDIEESRASEGFSKRQRKRKTMSDFHVGLAFDAILSKRKRSPEKENEGKANANKKRRQTIATSTKTIKQDDPINIDNNKTEIVGSEFLVVKKRRGRPKKSGVRKRGKVGLVNSAAKEQITQLTDDAAVVTKECGPQPCGSSGSAADVVFDAPVLVGNECTKYLGKKKSLEKSKTDYKDISSEKQEKEVTNSDKSTKKKATQKCKSRAKNQETLHDVIADSNTEGKFSEVLDPGCDFSKTIKSRKSRKIVSYCESTEITSCVPDSEGYSGWHDRESLSKPAKSSSKGKTSVKKKRTQEPVTSNLYPCDSTESAELLMSEKYRNDTEKTSSPPKKKAKTETPLENKKRKYNKKNSMPNESVKLGKNALSKGIVDEQIKAPEVKPTGKRKYVKKKSVDKNSKLCGEQNTEPRNSPVLNENSSELSCIENHSNKSDRLETLSNYSELVDETSSVSGKENDESGKAKKESICVICELGDSLIFCNGVCLSSFHPDCLGLTTVPDKFFCDECLTGNHSCFLCKETGNLRKCNQSACGKFYHDECASKMTASKFENNKLYCPLHNCGTCSNEKDVSTSSKKKLVRCVRCPTAYHATTCLVAGCMLLSNSLMVCHKHFVPNKNKPHHSHYNVSWCFVCSSGGMLVCCESCPAAFHPGCVEDLNGVPEEAWQCDSCRHGKKPLYGDLVWVKYGFWRWWPAKICYPDEIPVRIQKLAHDVGEFPVMFFGSRDYCWLHSGRVFPYQEGDKGCKGKKTTGTHRIFQKALAEVEEAHKELKEIKDKQLEQRLAKQSRKPPPFKHIKTNRYITAARTVIGPSELAHCECSPTSESPCGPGSECLNRMLQIECDKTCPAGEKCQNQRFQKCQHADCVPVKTAGCGWGLKTRQDIKKGDFVIEYVGELIDDATCRKRISDYHDNGICDYYFLVIDKDCIIDAYPKGNQSRFMNHSCDPNCDTQKWTVNGEIRVGLFANKDIEASAELTFNYNLDTLGNEKKACHCGSKNCSGFLGVRPKTQTALALKEKKKAKTKKKKKKDKSQVIRHEDECFACGDGGELIMCDKSTCSKCYHLKCLTLSGMPRGRWDCPWHFCDVCGKRATFYCNLCPNSFCSAHSEGQIAQVSEGVYVCDEHGDDNGDDNVSVDNSLTQDSSISSSTQNVNPDMSNTENHSHIQMQE